MALRRMLPKTEDGLWEAHPTNLHFL